MRRTKPCIGMAVVAAFDIEILSPPSGDGRRSSDIIEEHMSLGIYPVFESKVTGAKFNALGEVLAANIEAIDKVARSANLKPFTEFADNRPIPDDFDGDPDELADVMGEWTEWFDAREGQNAIQLLADHIKSSQKAAKRLGDPKGVVAELEEMARVLGIAASTGVRFRLELS